MILLFFPNKVNWAKQVRNVLNDTGFSYVWNNHGVATNDVVVFLSMLRQYLQYIYIRLAFKVKSIIKSFLI